MDQENKSENYKVFKAAGVVGILTMVSRVFGCIRDMVVAAFFGASLLTDAFWVAFHIPNLPRVKWVSCEIGKDNDYIRDKYLKGL